MSTEHSGSLDGLRRELEAIRERLARAQADLDRLSAQVVEVSPPASPSAAVAPPPPASPSAAASPPGSVTGAAPPPSARSVPPPLPPEAVAALSSLASEVARVRPGPPPAPPRPRRSAKGSIEQRVGSSWLNKVGIVVLVLGAVFFFQYAAQRGWVSPAVRCVLVAAVGAALILIGLWTGKSMRVFAAGVTGGGIALLYGAVYAASPKFYDLLSAAVAFGLMCGVTVLGVALSLRSGQLATAILVQIGAYLTPALLSTGRDEQTVLMTYLLVLTLGFLVLAWVRRWAVLVPIGLAGTILLFGGWAAHFYGPTRWAATIAWAWALLAPFLVFAAVEPRDREGRRSSDYVWLPVMLVAAITMYGLTVWLGHDMKAAAPAAMLALTLVLLAVSGWRMGDFQALAAESAALTFLLLPVAWRSEWPEVMPHAWLCLALVTAFALWASVHGGRLLPMALVAAGVAWWVGVYTWAAMSWQCLDQPSATPWPGQFVLMTALMLGLCMWRRWHAVRAVLLLAVILGVWLTWPARHDTANVLLAWAIFGLFIVDVLIRAARRAENFERLDATIAGVAMAAFFGFSYYALDPRFHAWMGLYAVALAAVTFALSAWAFKVRGRRLVGYSFLIQGLVLVAIAAPIQFEKASLTVAWLALAVASMFVARRLNSMIMLVKSLTVLCLGLMHFYGWEAAGDVAIRQTMLSVGGVEVSWLVALACWATAGALGCAALLPRQVAPDARPAIQVIVIAVGSLVYLHATAAWLPQGAADWWWMALAGGMSGVATARRAELPAAVAAALLALTGLRIIGGTLLPDIGAAGVPVGLNWQMGSAMCAAALAVIFSRLAGNRFRAAFWAGPRVVLVLLGALVVLWCGTFEVKRYFLTAHLEQAPQARQMSVSVWWAVFASGLLGAGFIWRYAPARYAALVVFAVTLGKVLMVDMAGVDAAYRIGSFVALGVLLVAASFLYQRHFSRVRQAAAGSPPARAPGERPGPSPPRV